MIVHGLHPDSHVPCSSTETLLIVLLFAFQDFEKSGTPQIHCQGQGLLGSPPHNVLWVSGSSPVQEETYGEWEAVETADVPNWEVLA